jgi:hypothetical protein
MVVGLVRLAQSEEEMLLSRLGSAGEGSADCWAARPVVAHNTAFKDEQVVRLRAVAEGTIPPDFPPVDHRSEQYYAELQTARRGEVIWKAQATTDGLVTAVLDLATDDLEDSGRHPWLRGRSLWLQVVVRGFWHPMGHVCECYVGHGEASLAVEVADHALSTARYLSAPAAVTAMAFYNRAIARAGTGALDDAAEDVRDAIGLNADLRANAETDSDLRSLRERGLLDGVLAR